MCKNCEENYVPYLRQIWLEYVCNGVNKKSKCILLEDIIPTFDLTYLKYMRDALMASQIEN